METLKLNLEKIYSIVCIISSIAIVMISFSAKAQTADTIKNNGREFKNTIHFNLTNPMIFGDRSLVFGYERVLTKNRSFSVNVGQASLPDLNIINTDELEMETIRSEKGLHLSADYRFYLSKENKYNAPRGVYVGPFYSYNYFNKEHTWSLATSGYNGKVNSELDFTINTIGAELGYQFILWKRLAIDLILIGPGVANYKLEATLDTNLSDEDKELFFDKLNEALQEKFPGYSGVIDEGEFKTKGTTNTTNFGFRYIIQVGYRF